VYWVILRRPDSQREHRGTRQGATREHVEHAQDAALLTLEHLRERIRIDARDGHVPADAIDHQRQEQEHHSAIQIAEFA